ncbi:prepilin-type N-terminal cleavage/methylation domain-containing protein [bacterium]|nr:MAG: prepilin-type N-terminal cleavage/methylation domain-containing protein [bacterium]
MKSSRAFTLIELLVVIAIIAILAAILFPVFAQAKAAAKKAVTLSNAKQINTALIMYMGDSEDRVPIQWYWTGQPDEGPNGDYLRRLLVWDGALMPYMKSIELMRSPNDTKDLGGAWTPRFDWGWKSVYPSWGFNLWYLNPAARTADNCASWNGSDPPVFEGAATVSRTVSGTEVANPAETVMIAETTALDQTYGVVAGHRAIPPVGGLDPDVCNYNSGGWGKDSDWETYHKGGIVPAGRRSANVAFRNNGQNSVGFIDGHAKSMPPGALAAGGMDFACPSMNPTLF